MSASNRKQNQKSESESDQKAQDQKQKSKVATKVSRQLEETSPAIRKNDQIGSNDLVGFVHMFEDGICESVPGRFSRTFELGDIGYEDERLDIQNKIYEQYHQLHAYFPPKSAYQLNLINYMSPKKKVTQYFEEIGDTSEYAHCYNEEFAKRQRESRSDIIRKKYFTFAASAKDYDEASVTLATMREGIAKRFKRMGVKVSMLDGVKRMRLMHSLLRDEREPFLFSYKKLAHTEKEHARDYVAPSWAMYHPDDTFHEMIFFPGHVSKTFHIRDFGNDLSDRALGRLRALNITMNISLTHIPQVKKKSLSQVRSIIASAQSEIYDYQASLASQNADITVLPPALEEKEENSRELLDFMLEKDQFINHFAGYVTIYAPDEDTLDRYEKTLLDEAGTWSIDLVSLPTCQEEAFTSALPLATPLLKNRFRSLATAESANMIPWSSQNVHHDWTKSLFLGKDTVSGGEIFVDPAMQKSPHMWVMGQTGAGKGMEMEALLWFEMLKNMARMNELRRNPSLMLRPKAGEDPLPAQWHIIDFHNEYGPGVKKLHGKSTKIAPTAKCCVNPLNISNLAGKLTREEVVANTDAFLALAQSTIGRDLTQKERSIIDRCLISVFAPFIGTEGRPILQHLYDELRAQNTDAATELADSFEMFVEGSMNVFNGQTNIEEDEFLNNYECQELGKSMETFAILSLLQHIKIAVRRNYQMGRITYLLVEEVQKLFDNDPALDVLEGFFAEERKNGLRMICVTQLPKRVLDHPRASFFFENSGTFVFLGNEQGNAEKIGRRFKLSPTQEEAIGIAADPGTGLAVVEGVKIVMRNEFSEGTAIYEVWNTDPDKKLREQMDAA